jgi:hypothetical protein
MSDCPLPIIGAAWVMTEVSYLQRPNYCDEADAPDPETG